MIVILCDGSSKGNPGPASIGVVVWDRADNPRRIKPSFHWNETLPGIRTNMEAEWEALLSALEWVYSNAPAKEEVYIFSDSQVVVKQATGIWKVKHNNIIPLHKKLLALTASKPENIHIQWVPRQLVYLADKAAQQKGV
jgi:ribonuclease HI/probable phosphoglycerate mutase